MAKVAVLIKTFNRDHPLFNCIQSIETYIGDIPYRLYIADDGEVSPKKKHFYGNLSNQGHVVLTLPTVVGASRGRNILLKELQEEKFVLRMDDDFELCSETNIPAMLEVLLENNNIGAVADLEKQIGVGKSCFSGDINMWQGNFIIKNNKLIKRMIPLEQFSYKTTSNGVKYAICDMTRNLILFKREVFNDIKWENDLYFTGEHEDLMLQIKNSKWFLAFTINSIHLHRDDLSMMNKNMNNKKICSYPQRSKISSWKEVFYEKWGVTSIQLDRPFSQLFKAICVKVYMYLKGKSS
jgi:glycosyltransferase involved in cell wall biosynthesis